MTKAQKALARLTGIRSGLYEDFKAGLLSKDDYKLLKDKYEAQHKELTDQIETLTEQKGKQTNIVAQNKWAAAFSSFQHGKELSRELVTSIIERIDVSDTNDVVITVKYRDEQLALLTMLSEYAEHTEHTAKGVAI